jgi:hypothetical protein
MGTRDAVHSFNYFRKDPIMKSKTKSQTDAHKNGTIKDPSEWTTGNEPMTGAQESYLKTLAREAGENVELDLTKADASEKIEELQEKTGRGLSQQ